METIFALATAPGRAGVAVVRLSGPEAFSVASGMLAGPVPDRGVRVIRGPDGPIDEALILRFDGPHSFTGEDVVEFHVHGSVAVVSALTSVLGGTVAPPAEAGEFTRRALENGKLDLAQVEGLADLIDAETEQQRKQAVRVLSGELGSLAETWRRDLIRAGALIEATIDFVDEDVPVDVYPEVRSLLEGVQAELVREAQGVGVAERIRTGFEVALVGAPNAGKSTLLNRLAGRDAAITSEYAGTTRDVIEVRMDLAGLPVTVLDTAGIRQTFDNIEKIGVERALDRAGGADLRVILLEPGQEPPLDVQDGDFVATAKGDIHPEAENAISGLTGLGVDRLIDHVGRVLADRVKGVGVAIRDRHRLAMEDAAGILARVLEGLDQSTEADLLADDIRFARDSIDKIIGRVDVEDLLDEIFTSFCIGK